MSRLTSRQFAEWIAFYNWHPFGEAVTESLLAQMCALTYNANRKKASVTAKPKDFLPERKSDWQTPDEIKRRLRSILGRGSR